MKKVCPFCNTKLESSLVRHIKAKHGEEVFHKAILADKRDGMSDPQIGAKYGISFSYLERVMTLQYGANKHCRSQEGYDSSMGAERLSAGDNHRLELQESGQMGKPRRALSLELVSIHSTQSYLAVFATV